VRNEKTPDERAWSSNSNVKKKRIQAARFGQKKTKQLSGHAVGRKSVRMTAGKRGEKHSRFPKSKRERQNHGGDGKRPAALVVSAGTPRLKRRCCFSQERAFTKGV